MEEKTLDEIAAEMRGRQDLNGGDLVDNFDIAAGEYGEFDALQLIHAYGECLDRAIRREREAFQNERNCDRFRTTEEAYSQFKAYVMRENPACVKPSPLYTAWDALDWILKSTSKEMEVKA